MNRVETAINDGRCVIAIGARALATAEVQAEMRRRPLPFVALGGDPVNPAVKLSAEALAPALTQQGGMVVLVEPEAATDGRALGELEKLIKGAKHKPRLTVAARSFNPFGLPMGMRLLKFDHEKLRAVDFVAGLPVPPAEAVAVAAQAIEAVAEKKKSAKKAAGARAPRATVIGREDELAALRGLLAEDGTPIVVQGPEGVGKRWLIEAALDQPDTKRLPDLCLSRGVGFDAFVTVLALAARKAGDSSLHDLLAGKEAQTPAALADAVVAACTSDALAGQVWVIHGLDSLLDRRDSSFYRSGRLEMVLRRLMITELKLRLVFPATMSPVFYREGEAALRRTLPVAGLKGRELHELFAAWHAPEFPRDRFGAIHERVHGHPLAARTFSVILGAAESPDVDALLERGRFLKAESLGDLGPLKRELKKRLSKLEGPMLDALHAAAMPRMALDIDALQALGINRQTRLDMLAQGILEQSPGGDRRFYVHPLVSETLDRRKVDDFGRMEEFGNWCLQRANEQRRGGDAVAAVALAIEGNRLLTEARRIRSRMPMPYPDHDADLENIRSLMRRRNARLDIARMRVNEIKKKARTNTELLLAEAELMGHEKAKVEEIEAAFLAIAEAAPTAEVFHTEASWHQTRNARGRAVTALERGVAAFPEDARLHRRLAGMYLSQNRREEAVAALKTAQELEPMMPDTYGMMGEISAELGAEHWDQAEQYIEEALRLAPEHPVHLSRKARLLRLRSMVQPDERAALLASAEALLREALQLEKNNRRVQVLLATVLIDSDGDLEQARWLLQQAMKQPKGGRRRDNPAALVQRARLLVRDTAWDEAERLIARAIKLEPSLHPAFAAKGELYRGKGELVQAFEAYKTARERSPREAPERALYEAALGVIATEIEAAAAAAAAEAGEAPAEVEAEGGVTTRPGATVLRKGEAALAEEAPAAEVEAAPAEVEAAPAEEPPAEAAPAEEVPAEAEAAPAEEAPAEAEAAPTEA